MFAGRGGGLQWAEQWCLGARLRAGRWNGSPAHRRPQASTTRPFFVLTFIATFLHALSLGYVHDACIRVCCVCVCVSCILLMWLGRRLCDGDRKRGPARRRRSGRGGCQAGRPLARSQPRVHVVPRGPRLRTTPRTTARVTNFFVNKINKCYIMKYLDQRH